MFDVRDLFRRCHIGQTGEKKDPSHNAAARGHKSVSQNHYSIIFIYIAYCLLPIACVLCTPPTDCAVVKPGK